MSKKNIQISITQLGVDRWEWIVYSTNGVRVDGAIALSEERARERAEVAARLEAERLRFLDNRKRYTYTIAC